MSDIIKPGDEKIVTIKMSPDMARLLASILGEYAVRIPAPPEEIFKGRPEEECKKIRLGYEERKKFAQQVCNSFFTNAHSADEKA